jgi:hypothetical protein
VEEYQTSVIADATQREMPVDANNTTSLFDARSTTTGTIKSLLQIDRMMVHEYLFVTILVLSRFRLP